MEIDPALCNIRHVTAKLERLLHGYTALAAKIA